MEDEWYLGVEPQPAQGETHGGRVGGENPLIKAKYFYIPQSFSRTVSHMDVMNVRKSQLGLVHLQTPVRINPLH